MPQVPYFFFFCRVLFFAQEDLILLNYNILHKTFSNILHKTESVEVPSPNDIYIVDHSVKSSVNHSDHNTDAENDNGDEEWFF